MYEGRGVSHKFKCAILRKLMRQSLRKIRSKRGWSSKTWQKILCMDESMIRKKYNNAQMYVRCKVDEVLFFKCTKPTRLSTRLKLFQIIYPMVILIFWSGFLKVQMYHLLKMHGYVWLKTRISEKRPRNLTELKILYPLVRKWQEICCSHENCKFHMYFR